jgi:LPXTG-motif cell wall-anchored protein
MYVCHPDGHTTEDYVTILTYEIDIHKVDGATGNALNGAEFELYKWIATANGGQGDWSLVNSLVAGNNQALFTWEGLDGGKYKLVETDTPEGYNTIDPIEFEIDAEHRTVWDKVPGYDAFTRVDAMAVGGGVVIADADNNGILEGNVANHKGVILPETGAEGTFFLITAGTILVVLAAVFMITRKKMSIYED